MRGCTHTVRALGNGGPVEVSATGNATVLRSASIGSAADVRRRRARPIRCGFSTTSMQQTHLSWAPRTQRIKLKRAEFPALPVWYEGPLPYPNMQARLYLYAYMVHLDHVEALTWPLPRLDALHTWDEALAYELLCRLMLPLAHLASLEHGQPTSRTHDTIQALRTFASPAAHTPWARARALADTFAEPTILEDVAVDTSVWGSKRATYVPDSPVGPRRTRSTARLEAALQQTIDEDEEQVGVRRSRRAGDRAARQRRAEMEERAQRVLGTRERLTDDAPPMSLESKIACLVDLCDALSYARPPRESPLHRLVQPLLEPAADAERRARQRVTDVEAECEQVMRTHKKRAPSMSSPKYARWKSEREELAETHTHWQLEARAQAYLAQRRAGFRSGPLGRDAEGRTFWHLLPACEPQAALGASGGRFGLLPHSSGHWSHALLVYDHAWLAATHPDQVSAILAYVTRKQSASDALRMQLEGVRDYLAWIHATAPACSPGTPAPP